MVFRGFLWFALLPILPSGLHAQTPSEAAALARHADQRIEAVMAKVISWRRDIHQHPELSNREFRTAALVAAHLRGLGLEVRERVAHTGVVAMLDGALPGPLVALRADMDGLPVTERVDLPFASKQRATYNNQDVGVMHACGHDSHVAMLMGAAEVLTEMRARLRGSVMFIFQPAEEGAPVGEEGGAALMVKQGVLNNPKPDAIFGLHISSRAHLNVINYRPGGAMASSDLLHIRVVGKQSHGASPWSGVDPVVIAAQIVLGLQSIVSRQIDSTLAPAIITIGSIHGGVRSNIIPSEVEMIGTIRALNEQMRNDIHDRIKRTATLIAESAGGQAEVEITLGYGITYNDPELTAQMIPTLKRLTGSDRVREVPPITGAEDFSFFAAEVPGFYFFLGATPNEIALEQAPAHHTPSFFIDEGAFQLGVRSLVHLTLDYFQARASAP